MKTIELPLDRLREVPWNPNRMDEHMMARLRESIKSYGLVENLVVRQMGDIYEVLSGNQRLMVLRDLGLKAVPCVVADLDDAHARLLAQALNHIQGQDDLGLRAELVKTILDTIPEKEIAAILPETVENLKTLASMGQETIAEYLENWQKAQAARLRHLQFQLTTKQLEVIEEAMAKIMPQASQMQRDNPNARGTALYLLCKSYLEREYHGH